MMRRRLLPVAAVVLGASCDGGDLRAAIPEEVRAGGTLAGDEAQAAFVRWVEVSGRRAPVPLRAEYRFAVEARGMESETGALISSRMTLRFFADDRVRMDLWPEQLDMDPELGDGPEVPEELRSGHFVLVLDGETLWGWTEGRDTGELLGVRMEQKAMEDAWGAMMAAVARAAAEFRPDEGLNLSLEYRGLSSSLSSFLHPARSVQALAVAAECRSMEMAGDRLRCRLAMRDRDREVLEKAGKVLDEHADQLMLGQVLQALAAESLLVEFDPDAGTMTRAELTHQAGREMLTSLAGTEEEWIPEDVRVSLTMELLEQSAVLDGGEEHWLRPPDGLQAEDFTVYAQLAATALRTFRLR